MAARSDNYYSLLSGAERVEEDVADLPFHPGRMASTSQFDEMSLEHQRSIVQLQRNSAAIDSGFGQIEFFPPRTLYLEAIIPRLAYCSIQYSVAAFLDTRLKIYDTLSLQDSPFAPRFLDTTRAHVNNNAMLVTFSVICDAGDPGRLNVTGLLCARSFPSRYRENMSHEGLRFFPIHLNTERDNPLVQGYFSQTALKPSRRSDITQRFDYIGNSTTWAQHHHICPPLPEAAVGAAAAAAILGSTGQNAAAAAHNAAAAAVRNLN